MTFHHALNVPRERKREATCSFREVLQLPHKDVSCDLKNKVTSHTSRQPTHSLVVLEVLEARGELWMFTVEKKNHHVSIAVTWWQAQRAGPWADSGWERLRRMEPRLQTAIAAEGDEDSAMDPCPRVHASAPAASDIWPSLLNHAVISLLPAQTY